MRIYALLVVAAVVLHARAASIPVEAEKKLVDVVPQETDKNKENVNSEQELLDQANSIKDVENNLRVKPEDIPVEVIVEDAQVALKNDIAQEDDSEINRPAPDLRNPGPPQRQEHETQNPEYYATEQQTVLNFKQSINDAQNILRQGLQGISDGIQNMLANNEPIQTIQQSILSLREGFTAQISKVNATIQNYLNTESSSVDEPAVQQTKASFNQIAKGLNSLKSDFNTGVKTLADGVEVAATLKAENEKPIETPNESNPSPTVAPASSSVAPAPAPVNPFVEYIQSMQTSFGHTLQNLTQSINNFAQNQGWTSFGQSSSPSPVPADAQSDTAVSPAPPSTTNIWQNFQNQITTWLSPGQQQTQGTGGFPGLPGLPQPGSFGSGSGPIVQAIQQSPLYQGVITIFQPSQSQPTQPEKPVQPSKPVESKPTETANKPETKPEVKPDTAPEVKPETKPEVKPETKPEAQADTAQSNQAAAVTPVGPIRQILQNNPITQGIAGAVQRLQNINNPEKPRDVEEQKLEEVKKPEEDKAENESTKGHGSNSGDNNNNSNSSDRVEEAVPVKEEPEKLPEVLKPEEIKEDKPIEVVEKTE